LSRDKRIGTGHSARVWEAVIEFNRPQASDSASGLGGDVYVAEEDAAEHQPAPAASVPINHHALSSTGCSLPSKLSVAVKIPFNDSQSRGFVSNEASIYAELPDYLSKTYSGFLNPLKQMNTFPACAVLPKCYGYYTPDEEDTVNQKQNGQSRMPILLIEKCGKAIEIPSIEMGYDYSGHLPESVDPALTSWKLTAAHK
jgi:hypothetical protein